MTEATDRSIPPDRITNVSPTAAMPRWAFSANNSAATPGDFPTESYGQIRHVTAVHSRQPVSDCYRFQGGLEGARTEEKLDYVALVRL